jgi:hypothetical protein
MAQNEELLQEDGELYPVGSTSGVSSDSTAVGMPSSMSGNQAAALPSITVISGSNSSATGQAGWLTVDYEWINPTAFAALAGTKYTFFEGTVPTGYRFILREMSCVIPFDVSSVGGYDLLPVLPAQARSSQDSLLVLTLNGSTVAQGLNTLDSAAVGATFNYAPSVFDLINGFETYRAFDENTTFSVFSYVTFPSNNEFATNSVGVKTRIGGVLIPKGA